MNAQEVNRHVWNSRVLEGKNRWTQPVSSEQVRAAKRGEWAIYITPTQAVPRDWLGEIQGKEVLCLASGGAQQGPILAAAGATVTVFDLSDEQLEQDKFVSERDGLDLRTVQGDMTDLSMFEDANFDLIVHPIANCFVPDVNPVWREAFRGSGLIPNDFQVIADEKAVQAVEVHLRRFGEGKGLTNEASKPLAKGVIETFDMCCQTGRLANRLMMLGR